MLRCVFPVRRLIAGAIFAGALGVFAPIPTQAAEEELVLAFIPQENPEKLIGDIEVISVWLSERIGVPVKGFVTSDSAAAVEALRNDDADVSFMGALPYIIANNEIGAKVVLQELYRGSPVYTGRVFVRRDSGISKIEDLKDKTIAFADPLSESGYLYPLDIFVEAGFLERGDDPSVYFDKFYFAGGYQQAMQAMANGLVDAAAASQYAELLLSPEQQTEIIWIAESQPIPSHTVIVRKGINADIEEKFVEAMLELNKPENRSLLAHVYSPDGFIKADPSAYDDVKEIARAYGFVR
jgi:phosphonate transport system substrate-binding protein